MIEGVGLSGRAPQFRSSSERLDCGNSGTTMRLLSGVLAGQQFVSTLVGDESLSGRPMKRVTVPLESMGARVATTEGHAPLTIEGKYPLASIEYQTPVASAQVKSCVLLAGLFANGRTRVIEPHSLTRDHTERMLRWFGAHIETGHEEYENGSRAHVASIQGMESFAGRNLHVPGDISSAAFLAAAAALLPDSEITIEGVGLNPTRSRFLDTLVMLGANVATEDEQEISNEPVGSLRVRGTESHEASSTSDRPTLSLRGELIAQLVDELPVLAVVGSQIEGGLEIREAAELRVKESDRISTTVANLRAMGAEVEEFPDGLKVHGRARLRGARLDSHGDHRIAMAFAIAALVADGETEIVGARECVSVSFPEFFDMLESVIER
jgi:3-phosphoshikimate 1-carboxyvinyltransferase